MDSDGAPGRPTGAKISGAGWMVVLLMLVVGGMILSGKIGATRDGDGDPAPAAEGPGKPDPPDPHPAPRPAPATAGGGPDWSIEEATRWLRPVLAG